MVRISKNTPAVTKVEECTRDETGVGAAIASGSHLIHGKSALLVAAAINTRLLTRPLMWAGPLVIVGAKVDIKATHITLTIKTSPTRLETTVISLLALAD